MIWIRNSELSYIFIIRADKAIMDRLDDRHIPISQIPGRPKGWLEKCVQILETAIDNK